MYRTLILKWKCLLLTATPLLSCHEPAPWPSIVPLPVKVSPFTYEKRSQWLFENRDLLVLAIIFAATCGEINEKWKGQSPSITSQLRFWILSNAILIWIKHCLVLHSFNKLITWTLILVGTHGPKNWIGFNKNVFAGILRVARCCWTLQVSFHAFRNACTCMAHKRYLFYSFYNTICLYVVPRNQLPFSSSWILNTCTKRKG